MRHILIATVFLFLMLTLSYAQEMSQERCGVANCHGLELSCTMIKGPQACNDRYELGDFCREYAKCAMVKDQCQLVKEEKFDVCAACVSKCIENAGGKNPFDCEQQCRTHMEKENMDR